MSAIITIKNQVDNATRFIDSVLSDTEKHFFFTGRSTPWEDEFSPPLSSTSTDSLNTANKLKLYMKKVQADDCVCAIRKSEWESGIVYTQYTSDNAVFDYRYWSSPQSSFYIINSEGNVYKCISNNYDSESTQEPTGQDTGYISTVDGYKWKFMYDLSTTMSDNFPSDVWTPVPFNDDSKTVAHLSVESSAVDGDISYVRVDEGGQGYTSTPTITVDGDGTGFSASAVVVGGAVVDVVITDNGTGYTYANLSLVGGGGYGSSVTAMISPVGGHGSNAKYELGATYALFSFYMNGDEDGEYPVFNTYRNIGIIKTPKNKGGSDISPINTDESTNTLSSINITSSTGNFLQNEMLVGASSLAKSIVYYDPTGIDKDVLVYNIEGDYIDGESVFSQTSAFSGIYNETTSTINDIDFNSGDILYLENMVFITRREIQTERFIFTIEF